MSINNITPCSSLPSWLWGAMSPCLPQAHLHQHGEQHQGPSHRRRPKGGKGHWRKHGRTLRAGFFCFFCIVPKHPRNFWGWKNGPSSDWPGLCIWRNRFPTGYSALGKAEVWRKMHEVHKQLWQKLQVVERTWDEENNGKIKTYPDDRGNCPLPFTNTKVICCFLQDLIQVSSGLLSPKRCHENIFSYF